MDLLLRVISGPHTGEERRIDPSDLFLVGRSSRASFPMVQDVLLSRDHFQIEQHDLACHLVDLGSTNGTKVNGVRVERMPIREGDVITAGESAFEVVVFGSHPGSLVSQSCLGCGARLELHGNSGSRSGEQTGLLDADAFATIDSGLCADCLAKRRRFPETHPDYLIEELVGEGGMGEVYRATQLSTNRRVAIKMLLVNGSPGDKAFNYFQREIRVLQDLLMPGGKCHPCIVKFHDIFQIDGHLQLVMEYVDGKNAMEWAQNQKQPLPVSSVALIGRQLLAALDYAHAKGYVHRDVKPSNILVMGPVHRPRIKLSDFGLAKSFADSNLFASMTRQGDIGGSTSFLSPDHIREFRNVKEPADIYSAGATLYFLLTNKYPYLGFDPRRADSYEIILEHPPVPLRAFRPDAPPELERILQKALQKQPRDRWKSARAMGEALVDLAVVTQS